MKALDAVHQAMQFSCFDAVLSISQATGRAAVTPEMVAISYIQEDRIWNPQRRADDIGHGNANWTCLFAGQRLRLSRGLQGPRMFRAASDASCPQASADMFSLNQDIKINYIA